MENQESLYPNLCNNIKALRKIYCETQEQLAAAIGEKNSAVANYEKGYYPKRDALIKIAKHYRVTLDELVFGKYPLGDDVPNLSTINSESDCYNATKLFPVISTEKALENINFRKAYERHKQLIELIESGANISENEIEKCCNLYVSAGKEGIVEGYANQLWWLMIIGVSLSQLSIEMYRNFDLISRGKKSIEELIKRYFLPSFDEIYSDDINLLVETERKNYFEKYEVEMLVDIAILKKTKKYASLGDFYLAMRYVYDVVNNGRTPEENSMIGREMLRNLSFVQNEYARAYREELFNSL